MNGVAFCRFGSSREPRTIEHNTIQYVIHYYCFAAAAVVAAVRLPSLYSRRKWKYFDLKDTICKMTLQTDELSIPDIRARTRIIIVQKMRWKTTPSRSCECIGLNGSVIAFSRKVTLLAARWPIRLIFHASLLHESDQNGRSSRRCQWRLTAKWS